MSTGISQCHKCGAIYDDDEACICSDPKDKTEAVYLDVKHLENMYELMKTVNDRNMKEKHSLAARVRELEKEVVKLKSDLKTAHEMIREFRKELEFYSQPDKWQCNGSTYVDNDDKTDTIEIPKHSEILGEDTEEIGHPKTRRRMWCAGRRARAVLQKWQGKLNENT